MRCSSNGGGPSRLPSARLMAAVAELESLIWPKIVKRTVFLLSEILHFFRLGVTAHFSEVRSRNAFSCGYQC